MIRRQFLLGFVLTLSPGLGFAQSGHAHIAPNGGQIVNIGKFEVELVATAQEIRLYLTDEKEQKVDAGPFSATASVLARGNQQRTVELSSAGGNLLSAKYDFPVEGKFRATVTLKSKDGDVGRGRFNVDLKR
jgi:hypothetical protein